MPSHIYGAGSAPSIAAGAGAGAGASASIVADSVDSAFEVSITTGTGCTTGTLFTVTFAAAFARSPAVSIEALDDEAAALLYNNQYRLIVSDADVALRLPASAALDATEYKFSMLCIGRGG